MATVLTWEVGGRSVAVTLDATPSQAFERTAEPTMHAVERGADVSDHVHPGADTVTLEGVVTNTPMIDNGTGSVRGSVRALDLGGGKSASVLQWDSAFDRVREVDALLLEAIDAGALVTLDTSLRRAQTDMVLTRHRATRSATIGDAVEVSLELRRVRLVDVRRVSVPDPVQRRGQRRGQRGAQPAGQTADRRSALARAVDSFRGLL